MKSYFMGIDTGTQGVRIAVSDCLGNLKYEQEKSGKLFFLR